MGHWNDFLQSVRDAENELHNPRETWYRGHSDATWNLVPSLQRATDWEEKEKLLFQEFKVSASRLFDKRTSDWETLFDMQHYWIPTRLLDWTTVMGVAIAFILFSDYGTTSDSALFILDAEALNKMSGRYEIVNLPEDKGFDYKQMYWEHRPIRIEKPIAVRPTLQSPRLVAQKGVFTVHGTVEQGFEQVATSCYRKVILKTEAKAEAREFIRWANLDEYTIYPDIVGMSRHITRKIM